MFPSRFPVSSNGSSAQLPPILVDLETHIGTRGEDVDDARRISHRRRPTGELSSDSNRTGPVVVVRPVLLVPDHVIELPIRVDIEDIDASGDPPGNDGRWVEKGAAADLFEGFGLEMVACCRQRSRS